MDIMTQTGLLLHQMGIECCDKGHCVDKGDHEECHCSHSVTVEGTLESEETESVEETECESPPDSCFS